MSLFGFLTNVFYHESSTIGFNDFELAKLKLDLVSIICYLVAAPLPEPVLSEGLRTIANLSRGKQVAKHICSVGFGEGLVALLNHESKSAVFYALGCLVNISNERLFYEKQTDVELLGYLSTAEMCGHELLELALQVFCNMLSFYKREGVDINHSKDHKEIPQVLQRLKASAVNENSKTEAADQRGQLASMIEYAERALEDDKFETTPMKLNELLIDR